MCCVRWSGDAAVIINRVKDTIATWMGHEVVYLPQNHILDLNTDGFIKPHVDSIKFSGRIVAGNAASCTVTLPTHAQQMGVLL